MKAQIGQALCSWLVPPLGRLTAAADGGRLGHGWLISGPHGVGKMNLACVLASRLLGNRRDEPVPAAGPRAIVAAHEELKEPIDLPPDLHRLRPEEEKRTISVDQVRELTAALALTPHQAQAKVVVIEAADAMTVEAANALLKFLEEPTRDTYLLLLAERPGRLPATIRSRCQRLALRGPSLSAARDWLAGDGLRPEGLSPGLLRQHPIAAARLAMGEDTLSEYIELQSSLQQLMQGERDPFALAESWAGGDTEQALSSLIEQLQGSIRSRVVPGHSNLVTDPAGGLAENSSGHIGVDALFAGLQMAENLREQLGRGVNVELALTSILVGIARGDARRL
jgi:DNA polymerase-3 subunit delta'